MSDLSEEDQEPHSRYGLSKIKITDKPLFNLFLPSGSKDSLVDYTFSSIFSWSKPCHLWWKIIHGCLCIFANGDGGLTLISPFLGKDGDYEKALQESLAICLDYNTHTKYANPMRVEYISSDMLNRYGNFKIEYLGGDYVYKTADMISLAGGKLASKRQAKNRFLRRYPNNRTEQYSEKHFEDCVELLKLWEDQTTGEIKTSIDIKRCKEIQATIETISHFKELNLTGMVLYVGDELIGFTFGELIGINTCSILIEKTNRKYEGSANYIFSEFCKQYWSNTEWCNVGDDWGVESLAWTKESFGPSFRVDKWMALPS